MIKKLTKITVILLSLSGATSAWAISLGDIRVFSHLSQPLHAEIEVPSIKPQDESSLDISMGNHDLYNRSGMERPAVLDQFIATLKWREDGSAYILLRTKSPLNELALSFFLELSWAGGRVLRQYDILLEPTGMQGAVTHSLDSETIVRVEPDQTKAPEVQLTLVPSRSRAPGFRPQLADNGTISYGPVRSGESLSRIAQRMRPDPALSLEQMMLAIFRENMDAFLENDMNNLSAGVMLHIRKPDMIARTNRQEAKNLVAAHAAGWGNQSQSLAKQDNTGLVAPGMDMRAGNENSNSGMIQRGENPSRLVLSEPVLLETELDALPQLEKVDVTKLSKVEQEAHVSKIARQIDQTRAAARAVEERNTALRERLQLLQGQIAKLQTNLHTINREEDVLRSQLAGKPIDEQQMVRLLAPENQADSLVLDDFMPLDVKRPSTGGVAMSPDQPVFIAEPSEVAAAPLMVSSPVASSSILAAPPKTIARNGPQFIDESAAGNGGSGFITALGGVSILSLAVLGFVVRYRREQFDQWLAELKLRFGKNKTDLPF